MNPQDQHLGDEFPEPHMEPEPTASGQATGMTLLLLSAAFVVVSIVATIAACWPVKS